MKRSIPSSKPLSSKRPPFSEADFGIRVGTIIFTNFTCLNLKGDQ